MERRLQLQTLLEGIEGVEKVYFQPPHNVQMIYPCIVYKRDNARTDHADNGAYLYNQRYQVTAMDRDPDGPMVLALAKLPQCVFVRHFTADELNHDIFTLYF